MNIVWFKRDFRLKDHEPLKCAIEEGKPLLLVAFLEPSLMNAPQSDIRHWRFVYQSVKDLNQKLEKYNQQLHLIRGEVLPFFKKLNERYGIENIFSHQETGLKVTYERDIAVQTFCRASDIHWKEFPFNGVLRGEKKRNNWPKYWYEKMAEEIQHPDLTALPEMPRVANELMTTGVPEEIRKSNASFQQGGERKAHAYLSSFLSDWVQNYNKHISKPLESRRSCSRLSPYLAWGNLSMRQVYQATIAAKKDSDWKWHINSFSSRLRWHCHFMQKFEMEDRYESENINRGYDGMRQEWDEDKYLAWEEGRSGYPLVDACMRAVRETGYINFRMRSMLVSFLTHHLWLHWKKGADFLARQFLDFEPGIHYPQFQMQAGTTGYNTIRIYNPIKQSQEHDPEGVFIKKWIPELAKVPTSFIHEPWKMTKMDQQLYGCEIGTDYPAPVVDVKKTYKEAFGKLWKMKSDPKVKKESKRILEKHTNA